MGYIEKRAREVSRRDALRYALLSSIKLAGLVTIAVVAPNVVSGLVKLGIIPHPRQMEAVRRSSSRMLAKGLLIKVDGRLRLTSKGEREIALLQNRISRSTPRKWDGRWRLLMFDIPERRKYLRQRIRNILREIGFVRMQDSVWVYPYECEDLMTLIKAEMRVGKDVVYLVAQAVEGEKQLRRHFKLPELL